MADGQAQSGNLILRSIDEQGVATLTLNRPDRLNAFNRAMIDEWAEALVACFDDDAVKVVVITGAGRAFCSGGDASDLQTRTHAGPGAGKEYMMRHVYRIARLLEQAEKPVIAAINGLARGGGMDMAMLCDLRIAAESVTLAESYINLGMISGGGGTYFLPRLVGTARALELLWTGDTITARVAEQIGLVSRVVPDEQLMPVVYELAHKIARQPAMAVRYYKRAVYQGLTQQLGSHLDMVSSHLAILRDTDDHRDRLAAQLARKKKS